MKIHIYPKYFVYMFAENKPVKKHNENLLGIL